MHASRGIPLSTPAARPELSLVFDVYHEAERVLEEEARRYPNYADIRHRRGLLRLARGEYDLASREFEDALAIHPGYRAAYFGLRCTLLLQGQTIPRCDASGVGQRHELAWAAVDDAYRLRIAGEDPLPPLAQERSGAPVNLFDSYAAVFALQAGDFESAARHIDSAAARSPIAREIFTRLSILPWNSESRAALEQNLAGLLWTPLAADLYSYLGRIYAAHSLRAEAMQCFDRAFLVFPREAEYEMHVGEIAIAACEESEALSRLTRAIGHDPECIEARIELGFEYASQGFVPEARREFEEAARLAPNYADVRYNLALLYVAENRPDDAIVEFRQAIHHNRAYVPARHSLASLLCRLGRFEEGLREYERLLRHGFQSADMLARMGGAALELGRTDEALQYLECARFLNPDYALTHYFLGQAYRRKGLRNKARSAWQQYLQWAGEWTPASKEDVEREVRDAEQQTDAE